MTGDDNPQLVHVEVDGSPTEVKDWTELLAENSLDGYEFIVTGENCDVRSAIDRDELVDDIASAVADKLSGGVDD